MIKDKLHTISDEDAIEVGKILLKSTTSSLYDFSFEKIERIKYDRQHGSDAEESVNVYFNAIVKHDTYRSSGWKDERINIKLIESDGCTNYPHFYAANIRENETVWGYRFLSNHIEAIEYLQKKGLL